MIKTIALLGAGGKMGLRLSANLAGSQYDVQHVEIGERGKAHWPAVAFGRSRLSRQSSVLRR